MSELNALPPPDRRVKIAHLVFGLLFLGLAGIWALVVTDVINEDRLPVLGPALLIGAGVVGLAASLASGRNRRRGETGPPQEHDRPYDEAPDPPYDEPVQHESATHDTAVLQHADDEPTQHDEPTEEIR